MFGKWSCNLIFFIPRQTSFSFTLLFKKTSTTKGNCKCGNFEFHLNVTKRFLPFSLWYCIEQVYLYRSIWTEILPCAFLKRNTCRRFIFRSMRTKYPYQQNQNLDSLQNLKKNSFLHIKNFFLLKIWLEQYEY